MTTPTTFSAWEKPTAESWLAVDGNAKVQLEVYQVNDEDPDRYAWFAVDFATGRTIKSGESQGLQNAQQACMESYARA